MQFAIVACAILGVALGQYSGYQGFPGYQGYSGYPGYQGYQGYQANRYSGYSGYPGYTGYQGFPGYQGFNGYQGYNGYRPAVPAPVKLAEIKKETSPKSEVSVEPKKPVVAPVVPLVAAVQGAYNPIPSGPYYGIRSQEQDSYPDGAYRYSFQTENGIAVAESGTPAVGPGGQQEVVEGQYSYTAPDGRVITVQYTADENGFHPRGQHLPTSVASGAYTAEQYRPYGYQKSLPVLAPAVTPAPIVSTVGTPVADKKEE